MTDEEKAEYERNLAKVDWRLPGMAKFDDDEREHIERMILGGDIVDSIHCNGWAFWPTENKGYYDARILRRIAGFIEIQNKPMEDAYDKWCEEQEDKLRADLELATGFREEDFE